MNQIELEMEFERHNFELITVSQKGGSSRIHFYTPNSKVGLTTTQPLVTIPKEFVEQWVQTVHTVTSENPKGLKGRKALGNVPKKCLKSLKWEPRKGYPIGKLTRFKR